MNPHRPLCQADLDALDQPLMPEPLEIEPLPTWRSITLVLIITVAICFLTWTERLF